ncbi:hypothetical protein DFH08DRAFT_823675 [Mycena albidolilacea]|uniref:Uncharacterized protein n=1 Tax=Mycena albidolilacea TaxID=1033008 RepID=A0AAD6Z6J1_9AGAR|nr:hypothetical protein DFH08DRAFT_823675 [Mycena albidolilacea]
MEGLPPHPVPGSSPMETFSMASIMQANNAISLNANEMGMIGSGYYGQSQQYQQLLNQPSIHQPNQQYHQPSFHQSTSISSRRGATVATLRAGDATAKIYVTYNLRVPLDALRSAYIHGRTKSRRPIIPLCRYLPAPSPTILNSIDECPRRVCEPITTHTQNYVPSAPILIEIHNTMKSMQAQITETNRGADEAEAGLRIVREAQAKADGLSRKGKLQADAKKSRLQVSSTHLIQFFWRSPIFAEKNLVHSKARSALGLGVVDEDEDAPNSQLPHILSPGEEPVLLKDGKTKKAHPNWRAGVTDPVNQSFLNDLTALVMEHVVRDTVIGGPDFWCTENEFVCLSIELKSGLSAQSTNLEAKMFNAYGLYTVK